MALSILAGNLFYAWQARQLALKTGRDDVTAIPFGVNAPTIFGYIFLIMLPVYQRTHDPQLSWHMGVFACLISGLIQTGGAFCTDWLRRITPPAALLSPIAGVALAFLSLSFVVQIFQQPQLSLLPTIIILAIYSSRLRLPWRLPAVGLAMVVGIVLFAVLHAFHVAGLPDLPPIGAPSFNPPHPINMLEFLREPAGWQFISIILPFSIIDVIGCLFILESVKLSGDDYPTRPSLLANGLATFGAACFGSAFPTTVYFGHMAHKAVGGRIGYSIINGVVIMLMCLTGLLPIVMHFVPFQTIAVMVVWFGLLMVGQAFEEAPRAHGLAIAFGLIPVIASWGLQLVGTALETVGSSVTLAAAKFGSELPIYGLIALSQGAMLTSMIWTATLAMLLDRRFLKAAAWLLSGAALSFVGLIHAYRLTTSGIETHLALNADPAFAGSYLIAALFLLACHAYQRHSGQHPQPESLADLTGNAPVPALRKVEAGR
jgi:AGZA family xanthine/uracil permease-like MFS transporter